MATHLIRKLLIFTVLWAGMVGLSGCTSVPESTFREMLEQPEDAHPAPIRFSGLRNRLPVGTDLGVIRPRGGFAKIGASRSLFSGFSQSDMEDSLADMMEMQGYDIADTLNTVLVMEDEDEYSRAEYLLGAKLVGADVDLCMSGDSNDTLFHELFYYVLFPKMQGVSGRLSLEIEWALYDSLNSIVAYRTTTKGYINQSRGNMQDVDYMLNEAFAMAAHNLGADKEFHDLVFYGTKPSNDWRKRKDRYKEGRPRKYDAQAELRIKNQPVWIKHNQAHIRQSAENAVLVKIAGSYGSGFFITKEGHILTNSHVVGDALRVRVVTAHKKEKLVAEVLRSNKARDVALLRLEEVPDDLEITPVPIKMAWPAVSEDIYAVGAPMKMALQDTITKGIVSAHRRFKHQALTANYIQGDVRIIGGNSGGPLLDANGNVIGVSVSGFGKETESDAGLNLFIPIEEALHFLGIDLVQQ